MSDTEFEPWYQLHPDRLTWELDQFERHNLEAKVSYRGRYLVITTELPVVGEPVEISAIYPDDFPYFGPTVVAPKLLLERHQDPVGLNFCLLEDSDRDWDPKRSAAELIGRNLRALLRDSAVGQDAVGRSEADMPEPPSAQFSYSDDGVVLVTELFLGRDLGASYGAMIVARGPSRVRTLLSAEGIGAIDVSLAAQFSGDTSVRGRWVALNTPPGPKRDAGDQWRGIVEAAEAVDPTSMSRLARRLKGNRKLGSAHMLVGLTFLEEGPARGEQRRNWLFVEIEQKRGQAPVARKFLASQALSEGERIRRIPQLAGLRSAHMIVIGAGSVGASVALEIAKAGVGRLDLIDNDSYDVNNAVRHVLGTSHAGEKKSEAVAVMCRELNPFCDVHGHAMAIGKDREARGLIDGLLHSATLIIDTTGAQTVGRFLTERARAFGVPLMVSGLTAASYGADILVVRPGGPCPDCFALAQEEQLIPRPPEGPRSTITPIGCRHPAFSGAGFEATELAAVTARLAVQVSRLTEYPPSEVNWVVLNFRGDPHYQAGFLVVRPCGGHD